ncbi:MAG: hypothetical protein Fur0022_02400 [Anaerolineales bacterium]
MFNDRDLAILGAGALLAVLCLLIPIPFAGKVVLGITVLVGFMFAALLRLGPDRIPLEEWLLRRIRYHFQARRYTYQQPLSRPSPRPKAVPPEPQPQPKPAITPVLTVQIPFSLAFDEMGVYPLVTALLAVLGVDFIVWLWQGGAAEIATLLQIILQ